jgi:hypothetical protein
MADSAHHPLLVRVEEAYPALKIEKTVLLQAQSLLIETHALTATTRLQIAN